MSFWPEISGLKRGVALKLLGVSYFLDKVSLPETHTLFVRPNHDRWPVFLVTIATLQCDII